MPAYGQFGIVPGVYPPGQVPPNQPALVTQNKAHSLDAVIQVQQEQSHDLDACIAFIHTASHCLDVDIQTQSDYSHFLDTYLQTTSSISHALDAVLQVETNQSHSLDAVLQVWTNKSHFLDVDIQAQTDHSHCLDAVLQVQTDQSHSLDAILQVQADCSHFLDAVTQIQTDLSHFLDALLQARAEQSHSLDTVIQIQTDCSHFLGAAVQVQSDYSHQLDAVIQITNDISHNLDASIQISLSISHSLDANVQVTSSAPHSLDAYLQAQPSYSHSLDVDIQTTSDISHSLDAYLLSLTHEALHSLDACIQAYSDCSHSLDAYMLPTSPSILYFVPNEGYPNEYAPNEFSGGGTEQWHLLDAVIQVQQDQSHGLDADIQISSDISHSLDALIQTSSDVSHSLDAYAVSGYSVSHNLDANIQATIDHSHNLDADILSVSSSLHDLDAYLVFEISVSHFLDVVIPSVYLREHELDVWISFEYSLSHSLSAYIFQLLGRPSVTQKDILLPSLKVLLPNQSFADENNCVSANITLNLTGGNFSISLMRDTAALPPEDTILTLPIGRLAAVKNIGRGLNTGGFLDTISGPIVPYAATIRTFVAMLTDNTPIGYSPGVSKAGGLTYPVHASVLAQRFGSPVTGYLPVVWEAPDYEMRSFNFRGIALQGIQQLAGNFLYDVIVYKNKVYVVCVGESLHEGQIWTVNDADLISVSQTMDFSSDFPVYLNPIAMSLEGLFIYDEAHAQKQPQTTIQAGAPLGSGGTDFIPIPDGWMVEGEYEEWTPASGSTDLSNPNSSVPKYWKVVPSPTNPGVQRGITSFTKLVRDLNLSSKLSRFVASPITAGAQEGTTVFSLKNAGGEGALFGFSAEELDVIDALTDKTTKVKSAVVLTPGTAASGYADSNFYSVPLEFWTFARVVPPSVLPPGADPMNPNAIPPDVVLYTPSSSVKLSQSFVNNGLIDFAKKNSPKMQTSVSQIYHGQIPQPGDRLVVPSADVPTCGRINSVTLSITRGGVTISISAEVLGKGTIKGQFATLPE